MIDWWAAISIGLLSSFHCFGMCGPIAFALPLDRRNVLTKTAGSFIYNLGRLVTYMLLGGLFGLLGRGFVTAGFQQGLSIALGVLILAGVALPQLFHKWIPVESLMYRSIGKMKGVLAKQFKKSSYESLFTIGFLNGLLPCGMVYLALAGAVRTGDWNQGAVFMLFFGLGTLPAMWSASFASDWISVKFRNKIRKEVPYFIAVMGVLFILRGLNLDIHYLSPKIDRVELNPTTCE